MRGQLDGRPARVQEFAWGRIGWYHVPEAGTEGLAVALVSVKPGGRLERHVHEVEEQVIHVIAGSGEHYVDGRPAPLAPGTVFHLPRGSVHEMVNTGEDELLFITVYNPHSAEGLLEELAERFGEEASSEAVGTDGRAVQAVEAAVSYIQAHFRENLRLGQVPDSVYLSPFYFSRIFKQVTGYTFGEYVTRVRLEEAKRLLRETDLPIAEVARRVGYQNPGYFSGIFRRHLGISPSEYRER